MPKANPLTEGLKASRKEVKAEPESARPAAAQKKGARSGSVLIGGHFHPKVSSTLKILAAEERTTVQALLEEALNTLFISRGKPALARLGRQA